MRMIFGLAGILVTLGIIVMLMNQSLSGTRTGLKAKDQLEKQIGPLSSEGLAQQEQALRLEPISKNGRLDGLLVKRISGGPLADHFKLQDGDTITAIGDQRVRDLADEQLAKSLLMEAKLRQWTLTVIREGKPMTLPQP